ncbi:MAG: hypothetical protein KKF33_20365 [Alphaproteobacteria bacterium]|nr:hypothetical protein [Alphaproteobacteria bacterium]
MALTKEEKQMVQEARDIARDLKVVLVGMNGDEGLCGRVDTVIKSVGDLASSHGKLKRNFWLLVGILGGSGVIGGAIGVLNGG